MITTEAIKCGSCIGNYLGEVKEMVPDQVYPYGIKIPGGLVIDANDKGCNLRFMNHSCDPNCLAEIWQDEHGEATVGLFSIKDIVAYAALTFSYTSDAIELEKILQGPCQCGSQKCVSKRSQNITKVRVI